MILHGVTIRNWKNIAGLELDALDAPLSILHGPNRTGKSSIVQAIRCCLFDYDHNSTAQALLCAIPWSSRLPPEVAIEFQTNGTLYRLTKRFSPRKEGESLLEQRGGDGWTPVERGKEASRQARAILGCEKSDHGLNQLLWLTQGQVRLPDPRDLDLSLRQRFEGILGSLLTASDVEFHDLLRSHCGNWFSLKTGRELSRSPVVQLREQRERALGKVDQLKARVAESESLVRQYDDLQAAQQVHAANIAQSRAAVEQFRAEVVAAEARRREHSAALAELNQAEQAFAAAQEQHEQHARLGKDLAKLAKDLTTTGAAIEATATRQADLVQKIAACEQSRKTLKAQSGKIEDERANLEAKRRLVELDEEFQRLDDVIERCQAISTELASLRDEPDRMATADEKELKQLQKNRRDAERLRAGIEAAALRVELQPVSPLQVDVSIDGGAPQSCQIAAAAEWQFRRQAELRLDEVGLVRVQRGTDDATLEESARKLEQLDRQFAGAMSGLGIAADDENWLETLVRRSEQRAAFQEKIGEKEHQLQTLVPEGIAAVRRQHERCAAERAAILEGSSALTDWTPAAGSVNESDRQLAAQARAVRTEDESLADSLDQLRRQEGEVRDRLQQLGIDRARLEEQQANLHVRLDELGDEYSLRQNVEATRAALEAARSQVEQCRLTADEEAASEKLEQELQALDQREKRYRDVELQVHGIRGQLSDRAGLHEELADAEAELERLFAELERAGLDADAHRLLLETFDACRESQVRRTVGPIEEQILHWTGRLGLHEYRGIEFADDAYLPTGLARGDVETPVALDEESYGTLEQLALLVRLAAGRLLAYQEPHVAILDDPLTHADAARHRAMLDILEEVTRPATSADGTQRPPLHLLIFTCHPERFDHLRDARHVNLAERIRHT